MRHGKNLLILFLLLLWALPAIQDQVPLITERPLIGFYTLSPPPTLEELCWDSWKTDTFQQAYGRRVEVHIGFRNSLIRLHNEIDYRVFGIPHAEGIAGGKNGYLYEEDYIHEYLGRYFVGEEILDYKLEKLDKVRRALHETGTRFVLVIEPGKASYFPEYIPGRFHPERKSRSNYDHVILKAEDLGIPLIDLNRYFAEMKDTVSYPLFPKYGMHWSVYGSVRAMDTLLAYIESVTQTDLPDVKTTAIEVSARPRWTDADIVGLLNLLTRVPDDWLAYPAVEVDGTMARTLSVLAVADSYYNNIHPYFSNRFFRKHEFWYYNSKLYPHIIDTENPVYIDKHNLNEKLAEFDIVLLMSSEINLHCGFWDFADEAYAALYPDSRDPPWYGFQSSILNNRGWFRFLVAKAKQRQIPLGEAIIRDAQYMYDTKKQ